MNLKDELCDSVLNLAFSLYFYELYFSSSFFKHILNFKWFLHFIKQVMDAIPFDFMTNDFFSLRPTNSFCFLKLLSQNDWCKMITLYTMPSIHLKKSLFVQNTFINVFMIMRVIIIREDRKRHRPHLDIHHLQLNDSLYCTGTYNHLDHHSLHMLNLYYRWMGHHKDLLQNIEQFILVNSNFILKI